MKFRVSQWVDTSNFDVEELPIRFGVQANKGDGWRHVAENGEPLLFETAEDAARKISKLRERNESDFRYAVAKA